MLSNQEEIQRRMCLQLCISEVRSSSLENDKIESRGQRFAHYKQRNHKFAHLVHKSALLFRKEKIAAAGGQMVNAAFAFIGEMFADTADDPQIAQLAGAFKARLSDCLEKAEDGSLKMTITLPDESFLDNMARSLARMAGTVQSGSGSIRHRRDT